MQTNSLTPEIVRNVLCQVIDPELGCNIVDLGLVYDIAVEGDLVRVAVTFTTKGCPMHDSIAEGIRSTLLNLDGVRDVDVQVVWEPAWNPSMLSPVARERLGVG